MMPVSFIRYVFEHFDINFTFHSAADDELGFKVGDIIDEIEFIDEGWCKGQCQGYIGLFPANYVEMLNQ